MKNLWQTLSKPILCLAPMEGVTDSVFRRVMVKAGKPDVMFTEFTSVEGMFSKGWDFVAQRLEYEEVERPLIAQVWGITPEHFYNAAQLIADLGFDGMDINFGCPDKAVVKMGACSALVNNKPLAAEFVLAAKEGLQGRIPLSVKIRTGFSQPETENWAEFLLKLGIDALTIHGRTTKQMSDVPADWSEIAKAVAVRNALGLDTIILGNGDVESIQEAYQKVEEYGVDGVMVGRGVFHNPWLFSKNEDPSAAKSLTGSRHAQDDPPSLEASEGRQHDLESVSSLSNKTLQERLDLLLYHVTLYESYWQDSKPFVNLRKYFKIYCQGFAGAKELRIQLMEANTGDQVRRLLSEYDHNAA